MRPLGNKNDRSGKQLREVKIAGRPSQLPDLGEDEFLVMAVKCDDDGTEALYLCEDLDDAQTMWDMLTKYPCLRCVKWYVARVQIVKVVIDISEVPRLHELFNRMSMAPFN